MHISQCAAYYKKTTLLICRQRFLLLHVMFVSLFDVKQPQETIF